MNDISHCPVCGMPVSAADITKVHNDLTYHLCSEQCHENFSTRPLLYLGAHAKKSTRKSVAKKRTFTLESPLSKADIKTLEVLVSRMMGVRSVQISGASISVSYDLLEATAEQIEKSIEQAGNTLGSGWGARLKRGWIHYTEDNELDNLDASNGTCCNKPPGKG